MFAWECIRSEGKRLGTCADGFLFGMCCGIKKMTDSSTLNKNITVNSNPIKPISTTTTQVPSTRTPTTTSSTTTTRSPSTSSHQPVTILKIKVTGVPSMITSSSGQKVTLKPRPSSPVTHIVSSYSTPSLLKLSTKPTNLVKFPTSTISPLSLSSTSPSSSSSVAPIGGVPGEVAITSRPQVHFPVTPLTSSIRTSLNPFVSSLRSTLSSFISTTTANVVNVGSSTPLPSSGSSSVSKPTPSSVDGENDVLIVSNDTNAIESSPSNSPLIATTPSLGVTQPPPPLVPASSSSSVKPGVTLTDSSSSPSPLQGIDGGK